MYPADLLVNNLIDRYPYMVSDWFRSVRDVGLVSARLSVEVIGG
jgi:hypothetical protein